MGVINMKDYDMLVIRGFMLNKLKLRDDELLVYAVLYDHWNYSFDRNNKTMGRWIPKVLNLSEGRVKYALKCLVEKGFVDDLGNGYFKVNVTN